MRSDRRFTIVIAAALVLVGCGSADDGSADAPVSLEPPTLRADGVGELSFGSDADDLARGLNETIGDAVADGVVDVTSTQAGAPATLREICWSNGFCAHIDVVEAVLIGWRQEPGDGALMTSSGVGPGASGADHVDVIDVGTGGCFEFGEESADGVTLELESAGVPFVLIDTGKSLELESSPPVEDVTVRSLRSGVQVAPSAARC